MKCLSKQLARFLILLGACCLAAVVGGEEICDLSTTKFAHSFQPAVLLSDRRVFVADSMGSEVFDPRSDAFVTSSSSGVCQRGDCAATLLPDGTVFVVG